MTQAMSDEAWTERAKNLLKSELKRRGVTYDDLAQRLQKMGVSAEPKNLANKVSRGGFSAVFLVQCLAAVGARSLSLEE